MDGIVEIEAPGVDELKETFENSAANCGVSAGLH